jgi:porcupine-like protein
MILMMKLISFSFDIDNFQIRENDLISYMDYLLSINTSIFGPWISYNDYLNHFNIKNNKIVRRNLFKSLK